MLDEPKLKERKDKTTNDFILSRSLQEYKPNIATEKRHDHNEIGIIN